MACKFSCFLNFTDAFKENDVGIFHAENGDVYRVTYKSNVCRDLLLKIEWTIPKTILLTVKLYNTTYKRCFSSKGMVVNGRNIFMKMRGAFNVSNSRNYKVLCVIDLIPYIKFSDRNEIRLESVDDSGFVESDFQQLSTDENNDIIYDNTKSEKGNTEEHRNDKIIKVNAISVFDDEEISKVEEREHQVLQSEESDFQSDETTLDQNEMNEDRDMSILLINNDSSNSDDQCFKTSKTAYESAQNLEAEEKTLENNSVENSKTILIGNCDMQPDEFKSSNETSHNTNAVVKSKPKDGFLITKLLTLDDYSEEIIEDFNTINISKNLESNDYIPEDCSPMEIDLSEMSPVDLSAPHDKDNILGKSVSKVNKDVSSDHIPSEIYQEENTECLEASNSKSGGRLHDEIASVITSESMEADFIFETADDSIKNNASEEKNLATKEADFILESTDDSMKNNESEVKNLASKEADFILESTDDSVKNNETEEQNLASKEAEFILESTDDSMKNSELEEKNLVSKEADFIAESAGDSIKDNESEEKNQTSKEADFILESTDVSKQSNESEVKDVEALSNANTSIYAKGSKKKNTKVNPTIKKGKRPRIKVQEPSDVIENAEINNSLTDNQKSESSQLPSSKTGLVFQTLVNKLSAGDIDHDSIDVNRASSSRKKIKKRGKSHSDNSTFPIMESELKGLSMDMLDLLTSGDMADASITNGEKHIKVHRAIISARSSTLKKLFIKHKEDEVEYQAVVEIPSYILEDVIIFLYVGLVYVKSTEMAQDLYKVAERYGINDLLDISSKHISK